MPEKFRFNKEKLLGIAPPATGRSYVYDEQVNGLLLMTTAAGAKSFQVRKYLNGKAARVTLGRFPSMTVMQAREAALKELSGMATTKQSSNQKRAEQRQLDGYTLIRTFNDYIRSHKNLKPSTVGDYERSVRVGYPDWEELPLKHITREMVETRHRERSEQSPARANNEMRVLRSLFNYAMEEYRDKSGNPVITSNPVKRLSHSKAWNRVDRKKTFIKPADLPAWYEAVDTLPEWYGGDHARKARYYFLMTLFNGYRRTESGMLLWENVDFSNRTLRLEATKNSQAHELPMSTFTHDLLREWQVWTGQASGYVFRASDNLSPLFSVEAVIKAIREKTGIQWTMHDLRRTFTTNAENIGITGYTLKRLINHKTGAADVTGGYIVTDIETLREPMQKITDKLLALASATIAQSKTAPAESNT